jgi:hypothetical protein
MKWILMMKNWIMVNLNFDSFLELLELDKQMRVDLDAKALTVPNKRMLSRREQDEKELADLISK